MAATGQIPRDCMVWAEGMSNWMPLFQVIHFPKSPPVAPNNPQHPLYTQYQAAMQGDAASQYYLACCYLNGEHAQKDASIPWLRAAAQKNTMQLVFNWPFAMGKGLE